MSRLLYVALTRTMHHLAALVTEDPQSLLPSMIPQMPMMRPLASIAKLAKYQPKSAKPDAKEFRCAQIAHSIVQSYRRTSFRGSWTFEARPYVVIISSHLGMAMMNLEKKSTNWLSKRTPAR